METPFQKVHSTRPSFQHPTPFDNSARTDHLRRAIRRQRVGGLFVVRVQNLKSISANIPITHYLWSLVALPLASALLLSLSPMADAQTTNTTKDGKQVTILDVDKDGWDDLWRLFYPKITHADRAVDTDGDGATDFEEMLAFGDPLIKGAVARQLTEEEKNAAERERTERDERKAAAFAVIAEEGRRTAARAVAARANDERPAPAVRAAALAETGRAMVERDQQKAAQARAAMTNPLVRDLLTGKQGAGTVVAIENGRPVIHGTDNAVAADTSSTDELWPGGASPLPDLSGFGRTMGIWEATGGPLSNHAEFAAVGGGSRVIQFDNPQMETGVGLFSHATQVAGTLAAAGGNALARGMSFQTSLHAYASVADTGEMAIEAAAGMLVSNHSYSRIVGWRFLSNLPAINGQPAPPWLWTGRDVAGEDPIFGFYSAVSRRIDLVVYDADTYLPVWSAGNEATDAGAPVNATYWRLLTPNTIVQSNTPHPADGGQVSATDTLKEQSVAKNNLVVGAVFDIAGGYQNNGQVFLANFSSRGPSDDGRIKPDLVADGISFLTTHFEEPPAGQSAATNLYTDGSAAGRAAVSGTSYAAPSVAGSLNLLQELRASQNTALLWASSWRSLLIHTADESGQFAGGGQVPGPDYLHGWGLLNTRRAADVLNLNHSSGSGRSHLRQMALFNSRIIQFDVVCDGTQPLRATIAWTDPAFQTTATADLDGGILPPTVADPVASMLINDLDLRITRPGGAISQPWVLNPAAPANQALPGDNFRDNIEQVLINDQSGNAPAGTYTIRVTHKGALRLANRLSPTQYELTTTNARQRVALTVTGNTQQQTDRFAVVFFEKLATEHIITWNSVSGVRYQVESSANLQTWTNVLGTVDAIAATTTLTVPVASALEMLFYRVREVGL